MTSEHSTQFLRRFSRHYIEDILRDERPLNLSWGEGGWREQDEEMRKKKLRTTFSGWQIFELEKLFESRKYINCGERRQLSRYG